MMGFAIWCDFPVEGYPAGDYVPPGATVLKKGKETLTIAGKSVTCTTLASAILTRPITGIK